MAERKQFDWAIRAAGEIEVADVKAQTLSNLASSLAQSNEFERALSVTASIDVESWKAIALTRVASHLANSGERRRAAELVREALTVARRVAEASSMLNAFFEILQVLSSMGEPAQVREILGNAFSIARAGGRDRVFEFLSAIAGMLARLDAGQTLWAACLEIGEIERWWTPILP